MSCGLCTVNEQTKQSPGIKLILMEVRFAVQGRLPLVSTGRPDRYIRERNSVASQSLSSQSSQYKNISLYTVLVELFQAIFDQMICSKIA